MVLSYHNDKTLKEDMIAEMELHKKQDDFIKGTYAKKNGHFKGCAVGCGVESLNVRRGLKIKHYDHVEYAKALGIPEWLARLEDTLFEGISVKRSKSFPLEFVRAIPIGKDLEPVKWRFCIFILKENIERVLLLKIEDKLKEQVVSAIWGVLKLHENAILTGEWDKSAAESAARSAWSVAEAASSAAEAARSARSAVRSAAYEKYADELLKLLKAA